MIRKGIAQVVKCPETGVQQQPPTTLQVTSFSNLLSSSVIRLCETQLDSWNIVAISGHGNTALGGHQLAHLGN